MIVIEMNPRVSRSSALASKATGFPIAKVAAKLAVGYTLDELPTTSPAGKTPASFEPSIDYVVTKVPRFAFEKFPRRRFALTTQMKSVGEVMAIGRTFQESLQKALRGLEVGVDGLRRIARPTRKIERSSPKPGPERIWYVADAFRIGIRSTPRVHRLTHIDPWFLAQIEDHRQARSRSAAARSTPRCTKRPAAHLKRKGFSDRVWPRC
jgi:carbamoyl-phosphate synthase large subunit